MERLAEAVGDHRPQIDAAQQPAAPGCAQHLEGEGTVALLARLAGGLGPASRVDQHQSSQAVRMSEGIVPGHRPAHGIADQGEASHTQPVDDLVQQGRIADRARRPVLRGPGQPMAGQIQTDHTVPGFQGGDPALPGGSGIGKTVDQDDHRSRGQSLVAVVDVHPVRKVEIAGGGGGVALLQGRIGNGPAVDHGKRDGRQDQQGGQTEAETPQQGRHG